MGARKKLKEPLHGRQVDDLTRFHRDVVAADRQEVLVVEAFVPDGLPMTERTVAPNLANFDRELVGPAADLDIATARGAYDAKLSSPPSSRPSRASS